MSAAWSRPFGGGLPAGRRPESRAAPLLACGAAAAGDPVSLPVAAEGEGPETLFFVHGWPDDEHLWDAQVAYFRSHFRCLRVTMPHFAGRAVAHELGHRPEGYDFVEGGDIVAATIRAECPGRSVILVIHDWGCLWGFFAQLRHPELVKAVVAMDVGPPSNFPPGVESWTTVMIAGLLYQHPLLCANVLARFTAGTRLERPTRWFADGLVRFAARLLMGRISDEEDLRSGRITADACYPYYYFQTNFGVKDAPTASDEPMPSCPCLFLYGKRKPLAFHDRRWEQHLRSRDDCKVVPMETGHWLQRERPQEVNRIMEEWLGAMLQQLGEAAGNLPKPRSRL